MSTESISGSSDIAALEAEITSQTAIFNNLRLSAQPVDDAKKTLAELKKRLALVKNAGKTKDKKGEKDALREKKKKEPLLLKTAKVRVAKIIFSHLKIDIALGHTRLRSNRNVPPLPHRIHH